MPVDRLASLVPSLRRPVMLLEAGYGGSATSHLVWGEASGQEVPWEEWRLALTVLEDFVAASACYGVLAYDVVPGAVHAGRIPIGSPPALRVFVPHNRVVLDHRSGHAACDGPDAARVWYGAETPALVEPPVSDFTVTWNVKGEAFTALARALAGRISAGELSWAHLSAASSAVPGTDPWTAYGALRLRYPDANLAFLDFGSWQLLTASSDVLAELNSDGGLRTRGRGVDAAQALADVDALAREGSRQEWAESGPLDAVAVPGVALGAAGGRPVHEVRAVADGREAAEVVLGMVPAWSVTGHPRAAAVPAVAELEPSARGLYGGAVGWMAASAMCLNVALPTAYCQEGRVVVQAGVGIGGEEDAETAWSRVSAIAGEMWHAFGAR